MLLKPLTRQVHERIAPRSLPRVSLLATRWQPEFPANEGIANESHVTHLSSATTCSQHSNLPLARTSQWWQMPDQQASTCKQFVLRAPATSVSCLSCSVSGSLLRARSATLRGRSRRGAAARRYGCAERMASRAVARVRVPTSCVCVLAAIYISNRRLLHQRAPARTLAKPRAPPRLRCARGAVAEAGCRSMLPNSLISCAPSAVTCFSILVLRTAQPTSLPALYSPNTF